MWCPSASLAVWANAWLAGKAAPDDVLDALSQWASRHSVTAYDAAAAGGAGLPWPDLDHAGTVSLLQTVRTAANRRACDPLTLSIALPVPGDVRGLPAGSAFARDAVATGEALIVSAPRGAPIGLVPDFEYEEVGAVDYHDPPDEPAAEGIPEPCSLSWTVYSLPGAPRDEHLDLGEAEYTLRSAVGAAAEALGRLRAGRAGLDIDDPRKLIEQLLDSGRRHRAPDHAPPRAIRVLENAAHIDAIITVSAGLMPIVTQSSSEAQTAGNTLRPLAGMVRSARLAAVGAIMGSAWLG
jgi:hypothetical protein